jgi:hypothetical protein
VLGWLACLVVVVAAVKLALGVALVLYAWWRWRRIGAPRKPATLLARLDGVSLWGAAGLAAFLQPWALVAAGAATRSSSCCPSCSASGWPATASTTWWDDRATRRPARLHPARKKFMVSCSFI